ncbi:MAG TPA: OmpA family protein [Candidatus Polarisedimenticolia bacterium]|jgi:chemotaxis protein MotB|nr:OmpA family protein [Candidatus Polarisedimenticolia bacterium]
MPLDSRRCSPGLSGAARSRALVLVAAGAVVIAGGGSTACVSTGRLYQVEQERDAYRTQAEKAAQDKKALEDQLAQKQNQESHLDARLKESEDEARKLQETYDGLVESLKKELKAGQIEVTQLRDGLRVNVSQDILFDSGSAALDKNGIEVLGRVASQLKKSSHQILVIGHTDNKQVGAALARKYPSNWELAGARASSVVRLFGDSGLQSKRMLAVSVADTQPVASNKSEEGRAKNRRIEIRLRPNPPDDKRS